MAETIVTSVQELLTEEKWTRATISNYSKAQFEEFAEIVAKICDANEIDEAKAICDEHLAHTKNSIIALYISGMLNLKKRQLDNSALITLVNIFVDNHKTQIVTFLCEGILAEDESNKFALRTLIECYREEDDERIWDVYEALVRLDYEEADIAKLIAENAEKNGDEEKAIEYYKKALLRYVGQKHSNQIKELWKKLIRMIPDEIDFFYLVQRKIAKTVSASDSALLMQELYVYYKDNQKWDIAIDILKLILSIDEKDTWARKEIVECFRGKYAKHSQLEEYIKTSNLSQGWRNVFEAISDFEKHIAFDAKNFVFHRSWGVGIIKSVKSDEITINFGKRNGIRTMSLPLAIKALQPLQREHIWVLKATKPKAELVQKVKSDIVWTLKTIIKSFDNNCDFKRIKAELVDSILTPGEWTTWSTKARKILETDASFGVNPNEISVYTVRERAISPEEKLSNEFKAQKNFFSRIDILMKFASEADTQNELFADMFSYFTGYLRAYSFVNEQVVASYLIYKTIVTKYPYLDSGIQLTFDQLFKEIENPSEMYLALKDTKNTTLRKDFLNYIYELLSNWSDIYIKLFPTVLQQKMLDLLLENNFTDKVKQLATTSFENYKDYREAAIYFFKNCQNEEWFKEINVSYEKQMIALVHIMDVNYKEIENHKDTTENRKLNRQIEQLLFKDNTMLDYMIQNDTDTITRLYTLVDDVKDLDPTIKMIMRNRILEKDPNFKFYGIEEKISTPKGLLVTAKMLENKKLQLDHLINVEFPQNQNEIAEAKELGDLKENAEFKAATEKQQQLNTKLSRLQDELSRAQVFDPSMITTARVSFGTVVTLTNLETSKQIEYTILGPWESDVKNNIISYKSPIGEQLLNKKEGEEFTFTINENVLSYRIEKIKAATF